MTRPATAAASRPGITFAVDDVKPADKPLKECRSHEAVRRMLDGDIESCGDYHGTVVAGVHYQPLLAAVYTAFSEHRPLILTPDALWITIAQGIAHHMAVHGERLRHRFVAHRGKLELKFVCRDWVEGSPENPWPEAFASWSGQIRDHVGPQTHDLLRCDFSTTGPVERAVGDIVLMDVFERYFHYVAYCVCGIPSVTLKGTPADWQRLRDKAAALSVFDLDWWLEHLLPVCDQFVRASRGYVDPDHWQAICKLRKAYGGNIINGWVAKLFPYLRAFIAGPCSERNPIFETGEGFQTLVAPPGLSRVPFTWTNTTTGRTRPMEAVGGLIGVTQDPATLALRPKVGWAVREAEKIDVLLARLAVEHTTFPATPGREPNHFPHRLPGRLQDRLPHRLPPDLAEFYHRASAAELFGRAGAESWRILPLDQIGSLDWGEEPDPSSRGPDGFTWYRLVALPDGSCLAINLDMNVGIALMGGPQLRERRHALGDAFAPVCHVAPHTQGKPGLNPVVALSFTELLQRLLDGGGEPFWLDPSFTGYGDAEQFTRRP